MKGNGFRLLKTDIQQEIENLQQLRIPSVNPSIIFRFEFVP